MVHTVPLPPVPPPPPPPAPRWPPAPPPPPPVPPPWGELPPPPQPATRTISDTVAPNQASPIVRIQGTSAAIIGSCNGERQLNLPSGTNERCALSGGIL